MSRDPDAWQLLDKPYLALTRSTPTRTAQLIDVLDELGALPYRGRRHARHPRSTLQGLPKVAAAHQIRVWRRRAPPHRHRRAAQLARACRVAAQGATRCHHSFLHSHCKANSKIKFNLNQINELFIHRSEFVRAHVPCLADVASKMCVEQCGAQEEPAAYLLLERIVHDVNGTGYDVGLLYAEGLGGICR